MASSIFHSLSLKTVRWLVQPFRLLDSRWARLKLVIFCGVFGGLFLNIFRPFNLTEWFRGVDTPITIILTFFAAAGMAALALSQFALRALLRVSKITRLGFLLWLVFEFMTISLAIHFANGWITGQAIADLGEYLRTFENTLMILILPYAIGLLLLYAEQQSRMVEALTLKSRHSPVLESVSIHDENGKFVITLQVRNILFIKSEDNYVFLYHRSDDLVKKELIRTTLKKLEGELEHPDLLRIHRSYMINSQNLEMASRSGRGYRVVLSGIPDQALPVSGTYEAAFEAKCLQATPE